ncbi:hypothetical protein HGRIS_000722 [Hohenbuehelia grisea]|uniref:Peroxidase n=1 Tax=Hohenbuehelia grisea TaxID=104357 RepID=A0ABR3IPI0_9AGAR
MVFTAKSTLILVSTLVTVLCVGARPSANPGFSPLDLLRGIGIRNCGNGRRSAHASLTFHDAISFSKSNPLSGGADGSIMQFSDVEAKYVANEDLADMIEVQKRFAMNHGVPFADFIQFAGAVGASNCAGGPRLPFFAGRPKSARGPAPDHLVPGPADSVDKILARMADAGFSPEETVDLLASHSIAAQHGLDRTMNGAPLDSTPSAFDTQFYVETLLKGTVPPKNGTTPVSALSPIPGEFRMQSDFLIARDPRTACAWQSLVDKQSVMIDRFQKAMAKLSTLGSNRFFLTDCSDVIPQPRNSLRSPSAYIPSGRSMADIESFCKSSTFPKLPVHPGPLVPILPVGPPSFH